MEKDFNKLLDNKIKYKTIKEFLISLVAILSILIVFNIFVNYGAKELVFEGEVVSIERLPKQTTILKVKQDNGYIRKIKSNGLILYTNDTIIKVGDYIKKNKGDSCYVNNKQLHIIY